MQLSRKSFKLLLRRVKTSVLFKPPLQYSPQYVSPSVAPEANISRAPERYLLSAWRLEGSAKDHWFMPNVLEKDKMTSKLRNIDQRKHIRKIHLWELWPLPRTLIHKDAELRKTQQVTRTGQYAHGCSWPSQLYKKSSFSTKKRMLSEAKPWSLRQSYAGGLP